MPKIEDEVVIQDLDDVDREKFGNVVPNEIVHYEVNVIDKKMRLSKMHQAEII